MVVFQDRRCQRSQIQLMQMRSPWARSAELHPCTCWLASHWLLFSGPNQCRRGHHAALPAGHAADGRRVPGGRAVRRQGDFYWHFFAGMESLVPSMFGWGVMQGSAGHAADGQRVFSRVCGAPPPRCVPRLWWQWCRLHSALHPPILAARFHTTQHVSHSAYPQSWLPARSHVKEALEQRLQVHPSGGRMQWQQCLLPCPRSPAVVALPLETAACLGCRRERHEM